MIKQLKIYVIWLTVIVLVSVCLCHLLIILLRLQELFTRGCNDLHAKANARREAAGCPLVKGRSFADLSVGTVYEAITWKAGNRK